jgi:hypothetical protein
MGLDMYLTGERFLWSYPDDGPDAKVSEAIGTLFPELSLGLGPNDRMRVKSVRCELMYWRKANSLHKWFVDNCQDGVDECQETLVDSEKLQELLDVCNKVLADPDLAPKLMPTKSGFFFGDTAYDDWYFQDIRRTVERLDLILKNEDLKRWEFFYRSSW